MNGQLTGGTSRSLPIQAAPVYRTPIGGARTGSGVEASGWLDTFKDVVNTVKDVGGVVGPALSAFGI